MTRTMTILIAPCLACAMLVSIGCGPDPDLMLMDAMAAGGLARETRSGKTAIGLARETGHEEVAGLLEEAAADRPAARNVGPSRGNPRASDDRTAARRDGTRAAPGRPPAAGLPSPDSRVVRFLSGR